MSRGLAYASLISTACAGSIVLAQPSLKSDAPGSDQRGGGAFGGALTLDRRGGAEATHRRT